MAGKGKRRTPDSQGLKEVAMITTTEKHLFGLLCIHRRKGPGREEGPSNGNLWRSYVSAQGKKS